MLLMPVATTVICSSAGPLSASASAALAAVTAAKAAIAKIHGLFMRPAPRHLANSLGYFARALGPDAENMNIFRKILKRKMIFTKDLTSWR
jgi:hypothetical protein